MPEAPRPKFAPHPFRAGHGDTGSKRRHDGASIGPLPATDAATSSAPAPLPTPLQPYAEMLACTNYSFLRGGSHPEELVRRAAELGLEAVAVADEGSLAGIVRAHVAAKDSGVRLVVAARLRAAWEARWDDAGLPLGRSTELVLYPTCMRSYGALCRLITLGKRRAGKGACRVTVHDVLEACNGADGQGRGLLVGVVPPAELDAEFVGLLTELGRNLNARSPGGGAGAIAPPAPDRVSLLLSRPMGDDDPGRVSAVCAAGTRAGVPVMACGDVLYHDPRRRALQDVLTCIRLGCTLEQAGRRLERNAERHLRGGDEVRRLMADAPGSVDRAVAWSRRCAGFSMDMPRYEYPDEVVPPGRTPAEHLRELVTAGAAERYPGGTPEKVSAQVEHELRLIGELGYERYFLTVHDIVVFARSRGILCQGRGAAANSAVCYCLGVTAVDPERIDVLFERFVSRERDEPPDIDIDFEHERREEVIQYIYAKYGRERAALCAEVITYRGRSAVREVGKALGLGLDAVDAIAKNIDWWEPGVPVRGRLVELGLDPDDATIGRLLELTGELLGFPRHLGQHVGGFVITRGPLCEMVPIENAAMPDRTIVQWDKDDIDAMGMLKVDVLGLGMLSCIRRAMELVGRGAKVQGCRGAEGGRCEGGRCKGAEVQRCGGGGAEGRRGEGWGDATGRRLLEEVGRGGHSDVSRPHRVSEEQGTVRSCVSRDRADAPERGLRADVADEASGGLDRVGHRRGVQPQDPPGVHPRPADRERIASRADHAASDRCRDGDAPARRGDRGPAGRDRPHAVSPDPLPVIQSLTPCPPSPLPPSPPLHLCTSAPLHLSLHTIPAEDPGVYDMVCRADTVGVFQIESRAQMSMLPRLRPRCFYDLVIEVAIVRPGPIQGKMVHPYLRRRNGQEPVEYPDETVRGVLGKTLGVPLFQEQAMSLAMKCAGFTAGEADRLRRAIAAWKTRQNVIHHFGTRIIEGMVARGYPRQFGERCFEQIKGFSEYGFPESHAASFALLVYASAWLKRHHPAAFAAALLNSQPMGFYAPAQIVRDAKEHGVQVRPIDVNASAWDCTLEQADAGAQPGAGPALRLGLRLVDGLGEEAGRAVEQAVGRIGHARSVVELWRAAGQKLTVRALRRLAEADAWRSMGLDRQRALWCIAALSDERLELFESADAVSADRGAGAGDKGGDRLPALGDSEQVVADYQSTGLSLRAHPVSFARAALAEMGAIKAAELRDPARCRHGRAVTVAGLCLMRQRPHTANGVMFMTIEDETGAANLIVRPDVYQRCRAAARHAVLVVARGVVQRQGQVVHVMCRQVLGGDAMMARAVDPGGELGNPAPAGVAPMSRDFR